MIEKRIAELLDKNGRKTVFDLMVLDNELKTIEFFNVMTALLEKGFVKRYYGRPFLYELTEKGRQILLTDERL